MISEVLSVGDGHQGCRTKLSIKKDLELPNCPKTGAVTFKTVLDKGYSLSIGWRLVTRDRKLMSICPRQMVSFCPLGGRDGFAFGEPLRRRCPWTDNNVILRRVLVFAGSSQSMKYIVIGLSDPDAVGAGPRHALPGLRVSYIPRNPPCGFLPSAGD